MDELSLAHCKYECKYHIVFAPKFRRQIIYGKIKREVGKILRKLCEYCDVFSNAYSYMLEKLKRNYPDAEIWCFTLAVSDSMRDFGFTLPFSKENTSMSKYCQAIRDCAKENDCLLIDIFDSENAYETMDDLHPNYHGMKTIADLVLRQLRILKAI